MATNDNDASGLDAALTRALADHKTPPSDRAQLALDLSEALAQIEKTPGIDAAIKTIRYVRDVLEDVAAHSISPEERGDLRWVRGYLVARADPATKRLGEVVELLERLGREP